MCVCVCVCVRTYVRMYFSLWCRNCLVGRGYQIKLADVAMCSGLYHKDYSEIGSRPPAPIRWLPWESILLVRIHLRMVRGVTSNIKHEINFKVSCCHLWCLHDEMFQIYHHLCHRVCSLKEPLSGFSTNLLLVSLTKIF